MRSEVRSAVHAARPADSCPCSSVSRHEEAPLRPQRLAGRAGAGCRMSRGEDPEYSKAWAGSDGISSRGRVYDALEAIMPRRSRRCREAVAPPRRGERSGRKGRNRCVGGGEQGEPWALQTRSDPGIGQKFGAKTRPSVEHRTTAPPPCGAGPWPSGGVEAQPNEAATGVGTEDQLFLHVAISCPPDGARGRSP